MPRALHRLHVSSLLLRFIEAGGDPSVFCYRMGVHILSAGRARFFAPAPRLSNWLANLATTRNQVACSTLFSIFSTRFSTQKN
jgi:hypothetical protein